MKGSVAIVPTAIFISITQGKKTVLYSASLVGAGRGIEQNVDKG